MHNTFSFIGLEAIVSIISFKLLLVSNISTWALSSQFATILSATATSKFCGIRKIGWGWALVIWLYNILSYLLLDPIKFAIRYALSGKAWNLVLNKKVS